MRATHVTRALLTSAMLAASTLATSGDRFGPAHQSAIYYLSEPTLIGSTIVQGPVQFVHDRGRMEHGQPCTTIRLLEPGNGPAEEIAAFTCIPTDRPRAAGFTVRTRPNMELGFGCVLVEFQFAGDTEAHGMPSATNAE